MAPPSPNWQRLLRVRPSDINIDNEAAEEENEELGDFYANVRI
jgi:hypothetical protein